MKPGNSSGLNDFLFRCPGKIFFSPAVPGLDTGNGLLTFGGSGTEEIFLCLLPPF